MRIGIDARLWEESGVGRYIRNLIGMLLELDKHNEYILFTLKRNREAIRSQLSNANFRLVEADVRWHTLKEQLQFPSLLNRQQLDLMHFPYFSFPILYKKPYVVTIHDLILNHFPTGEASTLPRPLYYLKLVGYRMILSQAARNAKKIITVSNATKKEIIDHLRVSERKIVVAYEGVGGNMIGTKTKKRNDKLKNTQYFLYVGNAYPHKNLERLIEAFQPVSKKEESIRLVLVGKEDYFYRRLREKVRRESLEEKVFFFGQATNEELVNLYQNALGLVLPSLMEGFGLPAIEAMANHCLVIASKINALKEICQDAAIYFDPTDTSAISKTLLECVKQKNEKLGSYILRGEKRVTHFSWKNMAAQTLRVYESSVSL